MVAGTGNNRFKPYGFIGCINLAVQVAGKFFQVHTQMNIFDCFVNGQESLKLYTTILLKLKS